MLAVLRGLVLVKRHVGPVMKTVFGPLMTLGRFLILTIGVPVYRILFFVKRQASRLILPAKHRVLYLVSNRYAIHVAVVGIAAVTSGMNMNGGEVRAEAFGKESILYAMVSEDDGSTVEVVASADLSEPKVSSYMDDPSIDANAHIDLNYVGEDYVTTVTGGSAVSSPAIRESDGSVAPRTEVETYAVQEGDTLGGISEQYGISLSTLLWANNLTFRSTIRAGLDLVIPPIDGVIYAVRSGDTVTKLASKYGSDAEQIISFNRLASADDLVVGEEIIIPGGEPPAPTPAPRTAPLSSLFTAPSSSGSTPSAGSSVGSGTWVWPTDWRVITQYYGWKHTGVDLDGDYTTHSYAAADGVVIFSGWKNGYGNCVEVDHGNGIVTRYAHHSRNLVTAGDVVSAGSVLADTGTTGRSTGTHLHFEVIKNGKFQNPLDYVR